ncbi:transcriptional regulator, IclR family [Quadrisphaera granulorum]|uniref:IclR family transcriptional regulator n=1 Tax=Quadrisphaera granulorum TaxID=317664 RepID=A0A316AW09_9ACTN|nr:IclR family transcriptional regulator [Quadrisphaera granulorum]SZE96089.1 transcriptional regulator, IclR family [Quadrisphaera granulorum]
MLRYLSQQSGPVQAGVISRDVGLPRSTTYHLLDTLVRDGFVTHLPEEGRYGLGLAAYELGSGYDRQVPLQRIARTPLTALADRCRHNSHLAVMHGRDVVYVIEERAPGQPRLVSDVGVRLPAHLTASGRSMLAALPDAQVRALFPDASAFVTRHGAGPTTITELRALLVRTRRLGMATEEGEVTPGFSSVAVAVLDHLDHPVAAVAVTFASDALDEVQLTALAERVRRTAAEVGRRLGGRAGQ